MILNGERSDREGPRKVQARGKHRRLGGEKARFSGDGDKRRERRLLLKALPLRRQKVEPFTSGKKDANPRFSPDGKLVAFTSKRDKESKEAELYVIPPTDGGEARLLAKFKYGIKNLRFTEDGKGIAVVTPIDVEKKPKDDVHIIKELPFWFNGVGWIYGKRSVVYLVDVESGKKKRLTPKNLDVGQIRFHNGKLYFTAQEDRERKPMVSDLYVLEGRKAKS